MRLIFGNVFYPIELPPSLAVPKSLADGIAMQNFVNDAYDVMIGVKRSEVFQNKNVTEIILVADEYGNQGLFSVLS